MQYKADIIERLEELNGTTIPPRERGARKPYYEAKALLWVLEIEHDALIEAGGLTLTEYIPDE